MFRVPRFVKWVYPNQIWSFDEKGCVYLTFDDGPHPEITPWLLDYLKAENIIATFFLLGEQVDKYPELVQSIRENGHDIGNHGHKHLGLGEVSSDAYFENYELGVRR